MGNNRWRVVICTFIGASLMAVVGMVLSREVGVAVFAALGGALAGFATSKKIIQWDGIIVLVSTGIGGITGFFLGYTGKVALTGVVVGAIIGCIATFLRRIK